MRAENYSQRRDYFIKQQDLTVTFKITVTVSLSQQP